VSADWQCTAQKVNPRHYIPAQHRHELYEQYSPCVIPVYQRQVVGAGATIEQVEQITPVIKYLADPYTWITQQI
jgi:hypothetical protein